MASISRPEFKRLGFMCGFLALLTTLLTLFYGVFDKEGVVVWPAAVAGPIGVILGGGLFIASSIGKATVSQLACVSIMAAPLAVTTGAAIGVAVLSTF